MRGGAATPQPAPCGSRRTLWPRPGPRRVRAWCDGSISSPAHVAHAGLNRRSVRLFKTTDKLDHAIASGMSTTLYANAHIRFQRMVRSVRLESWNAVTTQIGRAHV